MTTDTIESITTQLEKLVASMPDIVVEVRMHPADFKRLHEECARPETPEERERRERRESQERHLAMIGGSPSSIPVVVDPKVREGTPKLVRRSERDAERFVLGVGGFEVRR